ncbi:hypothetical protein [Paenibacillus sp. GSMTC-2017]|uniref:hypothetical protein n=1 Tax=Paenibacillus sp. GSMTC-2017 TaxID=2794350 RepID=UPI001E6448BA|nr:hypothetical protein [Paenibacillus sp. GSMTC-2017]
MEISRMKSDVTGVKRDVEGLMSESTSYWKGKASESFMESGRGIASSISSINQTVDELVNALRYLSNEVSRADDDREAKARETQRLIDLAKAEAKKKGK